MIRFDSSKPDVCLRVLADLCDNHAVSLEDIPQPYVDHFGLEVLSNSLNLVFSPLPPFDAEANVRFMESQRFRSYKSFCRAVATRPTDMDRLVCIYYHACRRISSGTSDGSTEDVFTSGTATSEALAAFIRATAFKVGITSFAFAQYHRFCNCYGWSAAPPYNHDAVLITIGGMKWIIDPLWVCGAEFDPEQFLCPLVASLQTRFPIEGYDSVLDAPFTFQQLSRSGWVMVDCNHIRSAK
jgi:hypothetical protein